MSVGINYGNNADKLIYDGNTTTSNASRQNLYSDARYLNHTKWEGARSGVWSMNDKNVIEKNLKDKLDIMGDSVIQFKLLNEKGEAKTHHPYNHEGTTIFSDGDGIVRIHSAKPLEEIKRRAEEKRQYLEKIIEYASTSDDACSYLLGRDCSKVLGKGYGADYGVEPHIVQTDARPSVVQNYDPSGELYARALTKFRAVFANANINLTGLETSGENKALKEFS